MSNRYFCTATFFTLLLSVTIILIVGPIDNPNKPFEEKEYLKFRNKSRIFAVAIAVIASFLFLFGKNNVYCFSFSKWIVNVWLLFINIAEEVKVMKKIFIKPKHNNYSKKLVLCSCPSNKDECKAAQGCYC